MSQIDEIKEAPRLNINEAEIELIQRTITEDVLKAVRALFFGLPVTIADKSLVKATFADEGLRRVMYRRFLPSLDREVPIGQIQDVWMGVEQMIFGAAPDTIAQAVGYKDEAIEMTRKALKLLEQPDGEAPDVSFTYSPETIKDDPLQIGLLARNQYIRHIESQLSFLLVIAQMKKKDDKPAAGKKGNDSAR